MSTTKRVVRKTVDGPSSEDLFDSLRLISKLPVEKRIMHFDVAQPTPESIPTMGDGRSKTRGELMELALAAMPHFSILVDGIHHIHGGYRYRVIGRLSESRYTSDRTFSVEVDFNLRKRRESGDLVVTWETAEGDDTPLAA